ncbi:MAG: hypothetical protein JOZ80_03910 [Acidobacteriaceae bacterium]|nr:hypothetical protein [Acidobacteriaceae bacterium]
MNNHDEKIQALLKQAFPPVQDELRQDLWPLMLRRMDERISPVAWFDWALLVLLIAVIAISPHSIPLLLYHL